MKIIFLSALGILFLNYANAAEVFNCQTPSTGYSLVVNVVDVNGISELTVETTSYHWGKKSYQLKPWSVDWDTQVARGTIVWHFPTGDEGSVAGISLNTALLALFREKDGSWTGKFSDEKGGVVPSLLCTKLN